MAPVKLLADPKFARAWPGGSGNYKMGRYVVNVQKFPTLFSFCSQIKCRFSGSVLTNG